MRLRSSWARFGWLATSLLIGPAAGTRADFATSPGESAQVNIYDDQGTLKSFTVYSAQADALAYDRFGNLLGIIGTPGSAGTIIGLPGGNTVNLGTLGANAALATNPFGGFAATPGGADLINIYDDQGNLVSFTTLTAQVDALAYDRFGNLLAILGAPGSAGMIVGLPNNVDLGTLGPKASLATNPFGGFAASAGDNRVNFYNEQGQLTSFTDFTNTVDALAFDRFGDLLAIIGTPGSTGTVVGLLNGATVDLGTLGNGPSLAAQGIPEPSSCLLAGIGIAGLFVGRVLLHQRSRGE